MVNEIILSKEMSIAINSYAGRISTGELISVAQILRNDVIKFLKKYKDVIINELMRGQNGGSPDYEHIDKNGTEKIIFNFEIIKTGFIVKKQQYQMTLTINDENVIHSCW